MSDPYQLSKSHTSLCERPMDAQMHIHTWTHKQYFVSTFFSHALLMSQMHRENLDLVVCDYEASYKSSRQRSVLKKWSLIHAEYFILIRRGEVETP